MTINTFIEGMKGLKEYKELKYSYDKGLSPTVVHGLVESQIAHMVFSLSELFENQSLIITYNQIQAKKLYEDLKFFNDNNVLQFMAKEIIFYDVDAHSHQIAEERIKTMIRIFSGEPCVIVASVDSLLNKIMPKEFFGANIIDINYGLEIDITDFVGTLIRIGYERVDMVEAKGQFSIRGGIIDIFSIDSDNPYRIELFDNEIDSIRSFDKETQLSIEKHEKIRIYPAKEVVMPSKNIESARKKLKVELQNYGGKLLPASKAHIESKTNRFIEQLSEGIIGQSFENYLNYFFDKTQLLTSYFKKGSMVFIDEPARVKDRAETAHREFEESFKNLLEKGEVLPTQANLIADFDELLIDLNSKHVFALSSLPRSNLAFSPKHIINFTARLPQSFHGKMDIFCQELKQWNYKGYKTILLCGTRDRAIHLALSLKEKDIVADYLEYPDKIIQSGQTFILEGNLEKGFEYYGNKFMVISENEIFGTAKKKRIPTKRKDARPIKTFVELNTGDYVVHENHGIGKYIAIEQLKVQGAKKDYLKIRYFDGDHLYVPIEQMDMVQKYIGADDGTPKLNKMGGVEWKKTKAKVKVAIEDMAKELLHLNAVRQNSRGYAFSPDTPWQNQFEDNFLYEETSDQLRCIKEVKEDMEKVIPMDRLLCGDVGYGKTEVAIRAAFKSVMDGKQVAVLVPTTILAQQHYNTFIQRFHQFPVSIEMLSRFRTDKQQEEIINNARIGNLDILIGTHRMLSRDVQFKELGLLIVDEEQRFGVRHKEAIKKLRQNVDIFTLTATPIPRTLHMSLIGLRDMSVIEDPPEERYPVQTYVMEQNDDIIKDAIIRELYRGGQVYFVYNRVNGIQQMASKIRKLVPEAKIAVGHGQMSERELENTMIDFMNGEHDILVCTTIIETGLDISNVNTIIIYDADKMGLSQLYQLRGRVGRSNRLAYAYLTYQKDKILTEIAEKRLKAIKEFTEFGSGFKIAMRDLEIRGAGNLLGSEQHGHMADIGYDLYCKLLEDTVKELKGEQVERSLDTTIEININAYIPEKYIGNEGQKLVIYKKIASIRDKQDFVNLEEEIEDRYGTIPEACLNLMEIAFIKAMAQKMGIFNVTETEDYAKLEFDNPNRMEPKLLGEIVHSYGNRIRINAGAKSFIQYKYKNHNKRINELREVIEKISGLH